MGKTRARTALRRGRRETLGGVKKAAAPEVDEGKEKEKSSGEWAKVTGKPVLKIKNPPKGLEEPQLREYFKQFGRLRGVYLNRSKQSGRPSGAAYVHFVDSVAAKVAQDSMHNYLLCGELLKCTRVSTVASPVSRGEKWASSAPKAQVTALPAQSSSKPHKHARGLLKRLAAKNAALKANGIGFTIPIPSLADLSSVGNTSVAPSFHMDSSEDEVSFKIPPGSTKKPLQKPQKQKSLNKSRKAAKKVKATKKVKKSKA